MKCERCVEGEEARYRVYTDAMEMKVCGSCAKEARRIGIRVEALGRRQKSLSGDRHQSSSL